MLSSDIMRGYNEPIILSILIKGDNYGYEILKEITSTTSEIYSMKEATLYAVILRLKKRDYISSYKGDISHGRSRTYYRITSKGKMYLSEMKKSWHETKSIINRFLDIEEGWQ